MQDGACECEPVVDKVEAMESLRNIDLQAVMYNVVSGGARQPTFPCSPNAALKSEQTPPQLT